MRAVGYKESLPAEDPNSLLDITVDDPVPGANDLLVKVKAVAVNPVDTKIRMRMAPESGHKIIGWDAVGEVVSTGDKVTGFKTGDRVWYAGDLTRPGCNAQLQTVDYRIVGKAPTNLDDTQAAALPLTSITAWEVLFDRLQVDKPSPHNKRTLLVIGGAGGVGSILIQLAAQLTDVTIIATASRAESQQWVKALGADHVINHYDDLAEQIESVGASPVTDVACLTHSEQYFAQCMKLMAPQGRFCLIDDPSESIDITLMKQKSISLHWEFMFTRSMFTTADMIKQQELLNHIAKMVEKGQIRSTLGKTFGEMNANNLRMAHQALESHKTIGKIALTVAE
ncbi:zinc-binding alcohol dehydrogenase family protein [Idiomarina sp. M1R2S28]|uniref:Zinc-type alcohol dehydrogenase-like protein n=1 Tax=Idiomarina rhizosphaerae TaxID=2961572 RepID=A0A9X2JT55_9GAMM|nr:zinc-binding alcohol dehydrogenase family protein [Idiomarina rhizosphaerae]MCP1339495.1 zinc-binding alcohol dehydrogenase family protein [Idiomarina rhizosphaerae]